VTRAARNMVRSRPSLMPKPPHWKTVLSAAQGGAGTALASLLPGGARLRLEATHRSLPRAFYAVVTVGAFF
jgi:hypothetical protein